MADFHVSLHPRTLAVSEAGAAVFQGQPMRALRVEGAESARSFPRSFEDVCAELAPWPRLHLEPDGSFVWVSAAGEPRWQLDGVLYDRQGRLLFVDLKGDCPTVVFEALLRAVGWPKQPVMFQLVAAALWVSETEFRRLAGLE